jgi:hypothetical protein
MNYADVLHAHHEAGRVDDSLDDGDSSTMARLRDGQDKLGTARHEHYACSHR